MSSAPPTLEQFERLVGDMRMRGPARAEAFKAWREEPLGAWNCALECFGRASNPAGLFLTKIRAGEHRGYGRRRTGWRRVRGSHGDSYVRDARGVDPLPLDHEH